MRKKYFNYAFFMLLALNLAAFTNQKKVNYKFDFGSGQAAAGYTKVNADAIYSPQQGYGFDFDTKPTIISRGGKDLLKGDFATSNKPFYFSVSLPEGNYKVTVTLGDAKEASNTTIKAESRRLMLENVRTNPGQFVTKTFIVNIKDRKINNGQQVSLKPRELTKLDWDDKLTLEFDEKPAVDAIEITPVTDQVTIFLAGNSTVVNQDDEPWASWGQMIPRFFKPGVVIANHAESGLALSSFLGSKRLEKVLSVMKPGDYLFIEFGHNDQKEKGPNDGAYKSYTERLKLFVSEAKKKGGIPVIVTSTSRRSFGADGKIENSLGDYPEAARQVAKQENVALIDLNAMTTKMWDAMGEEGTKKAFVHYPANSYPGQTTALADNTHFNPYGAYEIAKCIIQGIKDDKLGIAKYLVDVPGFDPSHPDPVSNFHWPESPKSTVVKPDGN
ncbi:rhamnogalacturonan acetylesterase [Mucilaginibacter arboris]|uniref:Rhamnogalacturonan acetylesterase n=1 Tax=Mucilaginibacter arboris TaxID=2682090 RepID=A0A7K1SZH2_9SPHI|nr:rhamnogalacturonan acetylesterase [Mucilaginibacter arboris]MVN22715.1 rhamnogalacturonan acetylesterase [Mucilaginibacter arboris]